ncbi:TPA: replication initiation factor domain-containing protein [Streptococcus suis]|nr:replication initiation factor domain-containing protein [Streptococcus suis]
MYNLTDLQNSDKQSLHVNTDEISIVIQPTAETIGEYPSHWQQIAQELTEIIADKLSLPLLCGMMQLEKIAPKGYTTAYGFENMPYFFRIAFHDHYINMGIIVKFSASALSFYQQIFQEFYNEPIEVYDILQRLNEPYWDMHLSRIDFCADYFNFPLSVNDIYQNLKKNNFTIVTSKGKKRHSKTSAIEINREAKTVTIGSRGKGTNSFLKIYDKKAEQLENNGRYAQVAQNVESWIRFEVTYKKEYARQLTKLILELPSRDSLQQFIANKIVEKYCLVDIESNRITEYSQSLLDFSSYSLPLTLLSPRNNELIQTVHYMLKGSGFFPLLRKVEEIWGVNAVTILIKRLLFEYEFNYVPNPDLNIWLKKNLLELQVLDFEEYLESIIETFYKKNASSSKVTAKKPRRKDANKL